MAGPSIYEPFTRAMVWIIMPQARLSGEYNSILTRQSGCNASPHFFKGPSGSMGLGECSPAEASGR